MTEHSPARVITDETGQPSPLHLAQRRNGDFRLLQDPESFRAIALYPITGQLAEVGCLSVLVADTLPELEQLCTAERVKRGRVAAERHGG